MEPKQFCRLAERLLRCPVAPGHEHTARAEAEAICAENGLTCSRDRFGNLLVRLNTAPGVRPLALAAHLDHPGFTMLNPRRAGVWQARFLGGVPDSYFRPGQRLRLMPGRVPAVLAQKLEPPKEFEVRAAGRFPVVAADSRTATVKGYRNYPMTSRLPAQAQPNFRFGVWDLEEYALHRGIIYGRACDDLVGVAGVLATLIDLKRSRARVNVLGLISRAEELGFYGALTMGDTGRIPKRALIVSLETSRELPGVKIGQGVILRVGDRSAVFDPAATRFLEQVASNIKLRGKPVCFQRALMSGGTCEATAYQQFGFQTAAVCIALGNYHNCSEHHKIAAEYVSVHDACGMVRLLAETARQMRNYPVLVSQLPKRIKARLNTARQFLNSNR